MIFQSPCGIRLRKGLLILRESHCHFAKTNGNKAKYFVYLHEKCQKDEIIEKIFEKGLDNLTKRVYNWVHKTQKQ